MKKLPQLCMFCGKDESFGTMNREHFVPRGLWAKELPKDILNVPAHTSCNKSFSDDNEYFRDVLAISDRCIKHPEVIKLNQGKIRRKIRDRRGWFIKNLPDMGIRPIFTESGLFIGHAPQFNWDWNRVSGVVKNVMKGIFFYLMEHPMPQNMKLDVGNIWDDADLLQLQSRIDAMSPWMTFGDDVFACRAVFHSADKYMYCLMKFYDSEQFYGHGVLSEDLIAAGSE